MTERPRAKAPDVKVEFFGQHVAPQRATPEMLEILRRMLDEDAWPGFERPDYLNELGKVAEDALAKETIEGHLAAVLLYHQLADELLKVLLDDTRFFVQCSVFPSTIAFCPFGKKWMTGRFITELEQTISFQGKNDLLAKVKQINEIRIAVVHTLAQQTSLKSITSQCAQVREIALASFKIFGEVHHMFRQYFKQNWNRADVFCGMHNITIEKKGQ